MATTSSANNSLPINGRTDLNSDPTRNFRFLVSFETYDPKNPISNINGGAHFGFMSVSGLSMAVESIPYREGGMNTTLHQIPGQASFSPITLTRGVHLGNNNAWRWMKRLFAALGPGDPDQNDNSYPAFNFRTSVTIHVLQHPLVTGNDSWQSYQSSDLFSRNDPVSMSFRVYNAWPSALAYSDLNAGDNAVAVEQMTLVHEGFEMYWATQMGGETSGQDFTFPN